jgi:hemolysin activation/secretion protein
MWGFSARTVRFASLAGLGFVALSEAPSAFAQSEPAALERTIPQPDAQTQSNPSISGPRRAKSARLSAPKSFVLGAVNIQGARTFTREELSRYFEPMLAREINGAKLGELAARITQRYRDSGYVLSYASIPSQNVEAGIVSLAVTEGRIARVTVDGAGSERSTIEAIADPLLRDAPLKDATLERVVGLIRDLPGISVTDVSLARTDADAGLYGLKIKVARNPVKLFTYMDNRGAESIGRIRLYSSVSLTSLAMGGDELRFDLFGIPGHGSRYLYGQVMASAPIGHNGLRVTLAASKGDQNLRPSERIDGDSRNFSAQLSYPMIRGRSLTMVGKASLNDWRSAANDHGVPRLRDRLRVARIGIEFSTETRTRLRGDLTLSTGLDFDGATKAGDPLASRPRAGSQFLKGAFNLRITQPLADRLRLQTAIAGQYSSRSLLSYEEFAVGGSQIGRAFDYNEITGDHGIAGVVELAYRLGDAKGLIKKPELFAYVDGGATFRKHPTPDFPKKEWLAGTGVGVRFGVGGFTLSSEVGVPVVRSNGHRSVRTFFSISRAL